MLNRLLRKLESSERPLLGPNYKALKFWGLLLPKNKIKKYFYSIMHLLVTIFVATEYVDVYYIQIDIDLVLNNLKITLLATMSVVKITTFLYWQNDWKELIEYVTIADNCQRKSSDTKIRYIIKNYTKYSRKITYLYWSLMYTTCLIVIFTPVFMFLSKSYRGNVSNTGKSKEVVSSWVPFDKTTWLGYISASIYQTYAAIYGGGWITSFDTNAVVIMIFMKGELQMLRRESTLIFGEGSEVFDNTEVLVRLKDCHRRHVELLKYAKLFNSCLSPIMLLYMIVCSFMLCVTAYQITIEKSAMQRFLTTEFLIFGIAQLFMYCWHSNEVLFSSQNLAAGPYHSAWWTSSKHRKDLHLLTQQYRSELVFTAGVFYPLNIATFLNILKGAYSYYTLLSKSQT